MKHVFLKWRTWQSVVLGAALLCSIGLLPTSSEATCEVVSPGKTYILGDVVVNPCGTTGAQRTELSTTISGENLGLDRMMVSGDFSSVSINSATTTPVKTGLGILFSCIILGGASGTVTIYDNTSASGTQLAPAFTSGTAIAPIPFGGIRFSVGLTIVTGAATVMQCSYL